MDKISAQLIPPYVSYFEEESAIYRDAFSFLQNTCEDITMLSETDMEFGHDFLESLLSTKDFSEEFQVSTAIDIHLQGQYFQMKNDEKRRGLKSLGVGYPILKGMKSGIPFSIPFFIWTVQLENINKPHFWKLSYNPSYPVRLNPFFTHFMQMKYEKDIETDLGSRFFKGISTTKLADFCNSLAEEFGLEMNSQQVSLMSCVARQQTKTLEEQTSIQWSAILGIFPKVPPFAKNEAIVNYLNAPPLAFTGNTFGLGKVNPSESVVIQSVKNNFITLVEGGFRAGKSPLLNYLATNGLSKGGKCLIVSNNMSGLDGVRKKLVRQGLGELLLLLREEWQDKNVGIELLKSRAKAKMPFQKNNGNEYRVLTDRLHRKKQKMEAHFVASKKIVFGKKSWQDTLGLFLEVAEKEPKELLNSHLDAQDFSFVEKELFEIILGIKKAPKLFKKVVTFHHPLSNLNTALFKENTEMEALNFIASTQVEFSQKAANLQRRFILTQNEYAEKMKNYYESYFIALRQIVDDIKDKISEYNSQFGRELQKTGKGTLKLYGIFSDKFKRALQQRENIFETYNQLKEAFAKQPSFEFEFVQSEHNVEEIQVKTKDFESQLQLWWKKQTDGLKDELGRLSHVTAIPVLNFNDKLLALEQALDTFLDELNASGLYQLPMDCTTLTLPRRQKFLEEKMGLLEQTIYHLRDFSNFYLWQTFWIGLSILSRKVIKALIRVNPNDWEAAFKSWYFHNCLTLHYDADLPTKDYDLAAYADGLEQLQPQITTEINRVWTNRRIQESQTLEDLVDDFSTESPTIKSLFANAADVVTDYFPVIITTPKIAKHFPKTEKIFDYLLIDEAQTAFIETIAPLFPLAKRVIVFTNPAEEVKGISKLPELLRIFHAPKSQHLICPPLEGARGEFFQTKSKRPKIKSIPLNARFSPNQTNEEEARKVIHLLNTIQKTTQRTFPSVGIACFTKAQRNLIASYLLRIKQQQSAGVDILQQLERNGLGVFHLEELSGQHFDILIVSATYGETGIKNALTSKINYLNTPKGVAQMYLLKNSAKKQLQLIHSIPEKDQQAFLQNKSDEGTYLFATLLQGKSNTTPALDVSKPSIFIHQLARLQQEKNPEATFTKTPNYLLQDDNEIKKLYLPDGCFSQTRNTDFGWEYEQRKVWEEKGYEIEPIWSVLKWKE